jgi:hypothetical protein
MRGPALAGGEVPPAKARGIHHAHAMAYDSTMYAISGHVPWERGEGKDMAFTCFTYI